MAGDVVSLPLRVLVLKIQRFLGHEKSSCHYLYHFYASHEAEPPARRGIRKREGEKLIGTPLSQRLIRDVYLSNQKGP